MKLLSASIRNFGSYECLDIDFQNRGLTLVSGPTGSGKSTLCDIAPWVLFGRTAKDGSVDEVRRWGGELTYGRCSVEVNGVVYGICRTRAPNDLYFLAMDDAVLTRGKDLNDTQKLINDLLGTTAEKFLSSAYYHEFSQAASFFTTTAKNRRTMTEQMVDLSLALKVAEGAKALKSGTKTDLDKLEYRLKQDLEHQEHTRIKTQHAEGKAKEWGIHHKLGLDNLKDKNENFNRDESKRLNQLATDFIGKQTEMNLELEDLRSRLFSKIHFNKLEKKILHLTQKEAVAETCLECGAVKGHDNSELPKVNYQLELDKRTQDQTVLRIRKLEAELDAKKEAYSVARVPQDNPYAELIEQIKQEVSPYVDILEALNEQELALNDLVKLQTKTVNDLKLKLADIQTLGNIVDDFRSLLIKRAVTELEQNTNRLLTSHFDAEIRCRFDVESLDKLDITILKDGNECSFTQLSKGQRQLLKLCFGVSVMRQVANHSGVSSNVAFLDESLDGLDDVLKVKSFGLFNELATQYESVFLVEHNSFLKEMFSNKIAVSLVNGVSAINES